MPLLDVGINASSAVRGAGKVVKSLVSIERKALSMIGGVFTPFNAAIAAIGGTASVVGIAKIADSYTVMASQLEFATGSIIEGEEAQAALYEVSKKTGTQMEENAGSFVKLQQASALTHLSMSENIKVIGGLNALMIKTGTAGPQASTAMFQLSQALTSGKLAGDEFRSMAENAPGVLNAMANAIGVPRSELKQWSTEGKLTSEVIGAALLQIAESGDAAFSDLPKTAAKGWNAVVLAFESAWDKINDNTGIIGMLSDALFNLGSWIEEKTPMFSLWIESLVQNITTNWPQIKLFFDGIYNGFTKMFNYLLENKDSISDFVSSMVGGLSTVIGWISKAIEGYRLLAAGFKASQIEFEAFQDLARQKQFIKDQLDDRNATQPERDFVLGGRQSGGGTNITNYFTTKQSKSDVVDITEMQLRQGARI